jgi:hypothetical protein
LCQQIFKDLFKNLIFVEWPPTKCKRRRVFFERVLRRKCGRHPLMRTKYGGEVTKVLLIIKLLPEHILCLAAAKGVY